jgi:dTDP-4-amino-4,6-dideoxygalactose transaminase
MPFAELREVSCYHILPILLPENVNRMKFMENMKARGIQTSIHYPAVHHFEIYEDGWRSRGNHLPVTEDVSSRQITLPLYSTMKDEQVEWVAQAVKQSLI